MSKIEELKKALWYANERKMYYETVDAFTEAMPLLEEAVEVALALGDAYDIGQSATQTSAIGRYRKWKEKLK
jgi:hypothetical protein